MPTDLPATTTPPRKQACPTILQPSPADTPLPGVLIDIQAASGVTAPFVLVMHSRDTAARMLGISKRSLDGYIAKKEIKVRRFGRRILIPDAELVRFSKADHLGRNPSQTKGTC